MLTGRPLRTRVTGVTRHLAAHRRLTGLTFVVAGIAAATAIIWALEQVGPALSVDGMYLLVMLPAAAVWGFWLGLVAAVASTLAFNLIFYTPSTVTEANTLTHLVVWIIAVYLVSALARRVRRHAAEVVTLADDLREVAAEQAALRRVATLVAAGAEPAEIFGSVAAEIGRLFGSEVTAVFRYGEDRTATVVGDWRMPALRSLLRGRLAVSADGIAGAVRRTAAPARVEDLDGPPGSIDAALRQSGLRSAIAAPITVQGRQWGLLVGASRLCEGEGPAAATEARIADFTALIATAIDNADARHELRRVAEEQAALRRLATLVARNAPPTQVFAAVTEEIGTVLPAEIAVLGRCETDATVTAIASWAATGASPVAGSRVPVSGSALRRLADEHRAPIRLSVDSGAPSVVAPIYIKDRLWGVLVVAAAANDPLPADTEARLGGFTELVVTSIANEQAQAELAASRARIVTTADETRRRIERDLHDGIQQRLVTLGLGLRTLRTSLPAEMSTLHARMKRVEQELNEALGDVREIARGIHPAVLSQGGLGPALKSVARRASVPVELDLAELPRLPQPVEVAAYYVVSEALTNTAKYAEASCAQVSLEEMTGWLRIHISDDGRGGAEPRASSGLVGLSDRIEALGGTLTLDSPPGAGTRIDVRLPLHPTGGDTLVAESGTRTIR